ncbi:MAG: Tad domain-containing protein [Pirellulaceae bacterium]
MKHRPSNRRGQSLIVMVLMIIALVGVLALTLDFGFVLLSRRSMQMAVNTAALEGARDIDGEGRENALAIIRNVFDDDFDPTENNTTLGAGPDLSLVQRDEEDRVRLGLGTGDALANPANYIFRPDPQLNETNEPHGDLVRGDYKPMEEQIERNDYTRDDFDADTDGEAFLARIRRTPKRDGIANPLDRIEGVSSSGGGSPLLIGHLAWFAASPAGQYDIRRDGVTVRATAIAVSKPIVHVGSADHPSLYPAIPYARLSDGNQWYEIADARNSLGEVAQLVSAPLTFADITDVGYAAVLWQHAGTQYVVGFQLLDQGQARLPNASPRMSDAWKTLSDLSDADRDAVIQQHHVLAHTIGNAPALVRSIR